MKDPRHLSIQDYTYTLPEESIAKYPLQERDASNLLIYKDGNMEQDIYRNIAAHIPADALLVFNNTKVVEARLLFQKPTGGIIEIFCLEPGEQYPDITSGMLQQNKVYWKCLVGGASKWKHGQILEKKISSTPADIILHATYKEKQNDHFIIELSWSPASLSFAEVLHAAGAIPLPPYIKRDPEATDTERYQTVYAVNDGSVAAPTAGLHFTETIFKKLDKKNIRKEFVTLHVGAGTFKPVKTEIMAEHEMHAEFIEVSKTTIKSIREQLDRPIIAVGTTSLRTIESLYWLGVKFIVNGEGDVRRTQQVVNEQGLNRLPTLSQWEPYELEVHTVQAGEALTGLIDWMEAQQLDKLVAKTQVIIAPGYKTKIAKALITNFHQPQSTLLLLVAALIGKEWRRLYEHALQNDFRFLSYGDGNLIWIDQD